MSKRATVNFVFSKETIKEVLEVFGKSIDEEGSVIDGTTKERVKSRYSGQDLRADQVGSVLPGSDVFLEDNLVAYASYVEDKALQHGTTD